MTYNFNKLCLFSYLYPNLFSFSSDADVRREGKEIGRRETLVEMVCPKLRKGKSAEVISAELDIDINIINHLCNIASSFAPNYDEDKILDKYLSEYFN